MQMLDTYADAVPVLVTNVDEVLSNTFTRSRAEFRSFDSAFASTLLFVSNNWAACTPDATAPVAPNPRLTTDYNIC